MTRTAERPIFQRATTLEMVARAASGLPAGIIGQVEGVALVYDVIDTFGTTFARGCLERTVRERVKAGKVRLFVDHGDQHTNGGMYDTHLHIGVVREVWDTTLPDGSVAAKFRADIFDTEAGRSAHEYLRAIAATSSETGVSIGMAKVPAMVRTVLNGKPCARIDEVPLREISVTALSSVPGTRVTAVRADMGESIDYAPILTGIHDALGKDKFRALVEGISGNAQPTDSDAARSADSDASTADSQPTPTEGVRTEAVPEAERLAWCRANLQRLSQ